MDQGQLQLFTFPSTFQAIRAEKLTREAGLAARLIPIPQQLSSLCGLALEVKAQEAAQAEEVLLGSGIKIEQQVAAERRQGRLHILPPCHQQAAHHKK